jgi:hypothetical protein
MGYLMDDWDSLRVPLEGALATPEDENAIKHAVDAAELVASASGEPPDELSPAAREWVERHGIPPEDLVDLAMRSMKLVANTNEWWRERINDLRFRLGDVAAS